MEDSFQDIVQEYALSTYYAQEIKDLILLYLSELTEIEKMAITIAKEHLETSFEISKSVGFREWLIMRKK